MEGVLGPAAVRGRVGERADGVQQLDDRAGPAVGHDQRQRVLVRRPHVQEVDVHPVDLGGELRQRVQPRLGTGPGRTRSPSSGPAPAATASCTPCERSSTSSRVGQRVAASRRRSSASSSSGTCTCEGPDRGRVGLAAGRRHAGGAGRGGSGGGGHRAASWVTGWGVAQPKVKTWARAPGAAKVTVSVRSPTSPAWRTSWYIRPAVEHAAALLVDVHPVRAARAPPRPGRPGRGSARRRRRTAPGARRGRRTGRRGCRRPRRARRPPARSSTARRAPRSRRAAGRGRGPRCREALAALGAEVGLRRPEVVPVGRRLDPDPLDGDGLAVDAEQLLQLALGLLVAALAEVRVADDAVPVGEVERRPVVVGEGVPDPVVVVDGDRVVDPAVRDRPADQVDVVLELELGGVHADHDQPVVPVGLRPGAHVRLGAQPVDAGQRPEVDEDDAGRAARLGPAARS